MSELGEDLTWDEKRYVKLYTYNEWIVLNNKLSKRESTLKEINEIADIDVGNMEFSDLVILIEKMNKIKGLSNIES